MDLDDVRVFTQVVESGSFTKAALVLSLPKSTVSRRVSTLEEELNVRLLQRTTRKLNLTPAGQLYFSRTSRIMADLEDAERALLEMEDQPRGLLRITVPGDIGGGLPRLMQNFQDRYPLVDVSIFSTGRRVDLIAEGYDLALRAGVLRDSSMVSRKLLTTKFRIFASHSYLEENGTPECLEDLRDHCCLIKGGGETSDTWKLRGPEGDVEVNVKGRLASNDFAFLRAAAVDGMGIGYLPTLFGREFVDMRPVPEGDVSATEGGLLQHLLPEYSSYESGLHAVYPSPRHLSPKVRAFIDFAAVWLKENGAMI